MRKVSIRITEQHYEMLEILVQMGEYASVSEAIRDAIRKLLAEKSELIEKHQKLRSYV
ncbi:MAG TPA: ribbon-helix-helix protein, CopG family [Archaeoglobus profundus]|nr:ribbon-helix-helix protein, CopG family [Archaeoglobus profundus]